MLVRLRKEMEKVPFPTKELIMRAFYPKTTPEILHKSKDGRIYRLDAFDKCIRLYEKIKNDPLYQIEVVTSTNEKKAVELISLVHDSSILDAYRSGEPKELANSSGIMWQPKLYDYVLEEAWICKKSVDNAMKEGVSLGLIGGGHHAEFDKPLGFSTINTMALSAVYANTKFNKKIALIDLDVHYSNGCFDILKGKKNILCSSIWNKKIDKWKYFESGGNIWHKFVASNQEYHLELGKLLENIVEWKPEFVIYHLGLDVLEIDRMGGIKNFGFEDLYKREEKVAMVLRSLKIPYVIFLGGAYIDYSKGEEFSNNQKKLVTEYQYKALTAHLQPIVS